MALQTDFLERCIATLDKAYSKLLEVKPETLDYEIYRSACVKEFEIILEQSGKLLKKAIIPFFHSNKEVDQLYFKDVFRNAAKYGLISIEETERWLEYRDNRNITAHDYGVGFAEETIQLIPYFISDALKLVIALKKIDTDDN